MDWGCNKEQSSALEAGVSTEKHAMKCAVIEKFGPEIDNLAFQERSDLMATGENVRARVAATALNRADLLQRRGLYPAPPGVVQDIPGLEFVGTIDQVGDGVTEWKGGERVFGVVGGGSYAEQVVTHQRLLVGVPDALTDEQAAAVPEAFMVAHDALITQGEMKSGDLVLVHSVAGGVGSAALQLVNLVGARAIGTAGSKEKLNAISDLAPFHGVNYREEDFRESIEKEFGENCVDLILDTVGANYWNRNLELLKDRGKLILLGLMGGASAKTPLDRILSKRLRICGSTLRRRPLEEKIAVTQAFARQILPHFEMNKIKPLIDSIHSFEQLHKATEIMERNENVGKIILTF
jgi:putative PIG3 family NAD(P)H quinone oxidoreductase